MLYTMKVVKRLNPEFSLQGKLFFSFILSLYDMIDH